MPGIDSQPYPYEDVAEARKQTPASVKAINVQIGPGDVISYIPVIMDFEHHQIHEGETYKATYDEGVVGTGLTKYSIAVSAFSTGIMAPHMVVGCDIYSGAAKINLYKSATISGGTQLTCYNRNNQSSSTPTTVIKHSVSSSDGTLIDSFLVGQGLREAGSSRAQSEWVLSSNTNYRVDMQGVVAGTSAIVHFNFYEDLGV
jgi:hypothetical protein